MYIQKNKMDLWLQWMPEQQIPFHKMTAFDWVTDIQKCLKIVSVCKTLQNSINCNHLDNTKNVSGCILIYMFSVVDKRMSKL